MHETKSTWVDFLPKDDAWAIVHVLEKKFMKPIFLLFNNNTIIENVMERLMKTSSSSHNRHFTALIQKKKKKNALNRLLLRWYALGIPK